MIAILIWRKPTDFQSILKCFFVALISLAFLHQTGAQNSVTFSIDSLLKVAREHYNAAELDSMIQVTKEAKNLASLVDNDSILGEINVALSVALTMSKKQGSLKVLRENLSLSKSFDSKLIARTYHNFCWHFINQEQYDSAIHYAFLTIPPYLEDEDATGLSKIYLNLGLCYEQIGDSILSNEFYQKSIAFPSSKDPVMEAHSKYQVDNKEKLLDEISLSRDILNYARRTENNPKLITSYADISERFMENQSFDSAIAYAQKGLDLAFAKNIKSYQNNLYLTLGSAFQQKGNYYQALHYYQQILNGDQTPHTSLKALTAMQNCYRLPGWSDPRNL